MPRREGPSRPWEPFTWPEDGTDPFDPTPAGLQWLATTNSGISRAFSAGDWRDWGDWGDFSDRVPMGYTALCGSERLAVCLAGAVAGEWPSGAGDDTAAYIVFHLVDQRPHWHTRSETHPTYDAALTRATALSDEGGYRSLVARVLRQIDWH